MSPLISPRKLIPASLVLMAVAAGCKPSLPPSTPLNELTPEQASGHQIFASRCAGCHYPNTEEPLHGPGLQGLYRKRYLTSGAPANDNRVTAVIVQGRAMMPAFGNNLDDQQLAALLAYLHTL